MLTNDETTTKKSSYHLLAKKLIPFLNVFLGLNRHIFLFVNRIIMAMITFNYDNDFIYYAVELRIYDPPRCVNISYKVYFGIT